MLNKHLRAMVNIINSNGGHVEQFIGDAIVAFFPGDTEISGKKAIEAAAQMRVLHNERMNNLSEKDIWFEIGIGLESGTLMAGTVKAGKRSEYVIIGHAREEAEKLEALSRFGRFTRILAGRQLCKILLSNDLVDLCDCEGFHELKSTEVKK